MSKIRQSLREKTEVLIQIKNHYGVDRYYPLCENGWAFRSIAGSVTLTKQNLSDIKKLGFRIKVVTNNYSDDDIFKVVTKVVTNDYSDDDI